MKNPYKTLFEEGKFGALSRILDVHGFSIKNVTEFERIEACKDFILENLDSESITAHEFIRKMVLIEKAIAGGINGKFFVNENTGTRFQAVGASHYERRLDQELKLHGLRYSPNLVLTKELLRKLNWKSFIHF